MRVRPLLFGLAVACFAAVAQAGGEHPRRLAAELAVMAGDVRRLAGGEGGPLEREGLTRRLAGALSSLPLLLRRAGGDPAAVPGLRDALRRRDWRALGVALDTLKRRHPLDAHRLLAAQPTPDLLALGATIHRATCAACHDAPAADGPLPANNLSSQIASMPRQEFAARLWLGVRGDRTTAWSNPFSDMELAALIAFHTRPNERR